MANRRYNSRANERESGRSIAREMPRSSDARVDPRIAEIKRHNERRDDDAEPWKTRKIDKAVTFKRHKKASSLFLSSPSLFPFLSHSFSLPPSPSLSLFLVPFLSFCLYFSISLSLSLFFTPFSSLFSLSNFYFQLRRGACVGVPKGRETVRHSLSPRKEEPYKRTFLLFNWVNWPNNWLTWPVVSLINVVN